MRIACRVPYAFQWMHVSCFQSLYYTIYGVMAARSAKTLTSDPEYLPSLMSQIGDDSESNDEFDGWLDDHHHEHDDETGPAPPCRRHHQGLGLTAEFAVIGKQESDIRLNITARAVKHPCVLIPAWSDFTHSKTIK